MRPGRRSEAVIPALLAIAGAATLLGLLLAARTPRAWLVSVLLGSAAAVGAAAAPLATDTVWELRAPMRMAGEAVHLRLDAVSALFLALLGVIGGLGALYGSEYWSERWHPRSARAGRAWWSVLLLALGLVLVSANGLHFLIGWELFALSAYFLVTLDRRTRQVRAAGWLYLAASHVSTLLLFAFFATIAARTGDWDLGPMQGRSELAPLFWLALVAFGVKAGVFPLHVWLPAAHANAPSHVSAMLSGLTLKIGIYGLLRFSGWMPLPDGAGWVVAALGASSAVLGVAFALGQHDLKRLLAYHSVENIGIILIGIGFALIAVSRADAPWGRLALAGGLLHVWNHGLFKALLFLCAGSVLHTTGTREMSRLGGLWRAMPWTTSLFALGSVAISGLPPLNGFVSEFLIYLGLFDATLAGGPPAWAAIAAAVLLGVTGALALACFVKVCGVVFLGAARSGAAQRAQESGPRMLVAMAVLATGCVAIGIAPVVFWPAMTRAAGAWQPSWAGVEPLVPLSALAAANLVLATLSGVAGAWLWHRVRTGSRRHALTWDCGYAAPTARMQYTAGSFASTIVEWFAWVLRPRRHLQAPEGALPAQAAYAEHTPETMLELVVEPAGTAVLRMAQAARRLQHGRIQAYLSYVVAGAAALAWLVWLWNGKG